MRTALQIALERARAGQQEGPALSEEQKRQLTDLRRSTEAKLAEKKILVEQEMREAARAGDWPRVSRLQSELAEELARIERQAAQQEQRLRAGAPEQAQQQPEEER